MRATVSSVGGKQRSNAESCSLRAVESGQSRLLGWPRHDSGGVRDADGKISLRLIDDLEIQIAQLTVQHKRQGADHRYIPVLVTAPDIGWINAYTIASEIGDSSISKHCPKYLRWALFEAPTVSPHRAPNHPSALTPLDTACSFMNDNPPSFIATTSVRLGLRRPDARSCCRARR
jgi:hypothetical protein